MQCHYTCDALYKAFCSALLAEGVTDNNLRMQEIALKTLLEVEPLHQRSSQHREQAVQELIARLHTYDFLDPFLRDPTVTEIMINGPSQVFVERRQGIKAYESNLSHDRLMALIRKITAEVNRSINLSNPIIDARLKDGSRFNAVLDPIALNGPIITIRKFLTSFNSLEALMDQGMFDRTTLSLLREAMQGQKNIFISGGTSTGKTTLLNALCTEIHQKERVITIEDSAELNLVNLANLVRLETRHSQLKDMQSIHIQDLIKASLRMRPDRIIVGEIRGKEAYDMLQAMNTGHDGSLSTGHANSAKDMIERIKVMSLMNEHASEQGVLQQIFSGVHWIIHLSRDDAGKRVIDHILELTPDGRHHRIMSLSDDCLLDRMDGLSLNEEASS